MTSETDKQFLERMIAISRGDQVFTTRGDLERLLNITAYSIGNVNRRVRLVRTMAAWVIASGPDGIERQWTHGFTYKQHTCWNCGKAIAVNSHGDTTIKDGWAWRPANHLNVPGAIHELRVHSYCLRE